MRNINSNEKWNVVSVNISGCGIDFSRIFNWIIFFSIIFGKNIYIPLLLEGTLTGKPHKKTTSTGNSSIHYFTSQLRWANKYSQEKKYFLEGEKWIFFNLCGMRDKRIQILKMVLVKCVELFIHCTTFFLPTSTPTMIH